MRRRRHLLREDVEDEVRRAAQVELHDRAPGGALFLPCFPRVFELEVCRYALELSVSL